MSHSKPPLMALCEMMPGQLADFFALLSERARKETRDGKPYYQCRFRQGGRTVGFHAWADSTWFESCEREWRKGQVYKIRATYGDHDRYGPQIDIHNIRPVNEEDRTDGFDPEEFVAHSRFAAGEMFGELLDLARTQVSNAPLQRLIVTILERHAEALKRLPATTRHAYAFAGGLVEHLLSVTRAAILLADHYARRYPDARPPLNRDLVVAGAILHDIGRVLEFRDENVQVERTVRGKLLGPLLLARDLVRDTARELGDLNPELLQLLEHVLIAHVNLLEKDSPRLPLVPECLIVHFADGLDSYMEMFLRGIENDREPDSFTSHIPILGRELFKGRSV